MKTHTHLQSSWTIACTLLWFILALVTCVRLTTERHSHTQIQGNVINSITHTPVNTNEAKTNPFLLMVCLRFNKKAFFTSSFYHRAEQKRCPGHTLFQCLEDLQRSQLNKRADGCRPSLFLCVSSSFCFSSFFSISATSMRYTSHRKKSKRMNSKSRAAATTRKSMI